LLLVAFLLVNAPNCHFSPVLASVLQGDAVNCNKGSKCPNARLVVFLLTTLAWLLCRM